MSFTRIATVLSCLVDGCSCCVAVTWLVISCLELLVAPEAKELLYIFGIKVLSLGTNGIDSVWLEVRARRDKTILPFSIHGIKDNNEFQKCK